MLPVKITAATSYWAKEKEKNEEKQSDSEVGICQTVILRVTGNRLLISSLWSASVCVDKSPNQFHVPVRGAFVRHMKKY